MKYGVQRSALLAAAAMFSFAAAPALAEEAGPDAPTPTISVDLTLGVYSDYRFRGLSLSEKDPAFQPSLTVTHKSGVYASVWGSNIADNAGDDVEIDLTLGYSGNIGDGFKLGALAVYYVYPGISSINYAEFQGSLSRDIGPANIGVLVAYSPKQDNTGDRDNTYVAVNGSVPLGSSPFTLTGSFGIEDGAFGDKKRDWSLGVTTEVKGFNLGLSYVDTARASRIGAGSIGKATAVFSISRTF